MRWLAAALAVVGTVSGCVRLAEFHDQTRPVAPGTRSGNRVHAEKCMFSLFYVFPFGDHPLPEAKAEADQLGGGSGLTNVDVEYEWIFAVVGNVLCAKVTGDAAGASAISTNRPAPASTTPASVQPATSPAPAPLPQPTSALLTTRIELGSPELHERAIPVLRSWIGQPVALIFLDGTSAKGILLSVEDSTLSILGAAPTPNAEGTRSEPFDRIRVVKLLK